MLIEAESIPYEPALLRGERLLVLAPHPDDEVIGAGGLTALHLLERRAVRAVIVTDGAQAGDARARQDESRRALARLGDAEVQFLGFPDRGLDDSVAPLLREQLLEFRPDLILVPSPLEIHPDHLELARAFAGLIQRDETLFAELAVARVAFYEVGTPIRPNALVDITAVADAKYAAIAEHASQLAVRDYVGYARGLNAYRAMTLPPTVRFAEAYHVVDLPSLRTTPLSALQRAMSAAPRAEITSEPAPVTVVVRTRNRAALLREAVASIRATGYPCEIVIVNDGGGDASVPADITSGEPASIQVITHDQSRGRAEAGNAGARAAKSAMIAFLDDDDLFYPEHLAVLTAAAQSAHAGWYSDAVSSFLRPGPDGTYESHSRLRLFAQDYDRDLLLLDNYIPLPTLLVPRQTFLDAGGFDPAFDLFEDWDFLIRLSRRGDLLRVPRVTCEIRHFEGGSSVLLAAPEGSPRFRAAKLQVWKKHAALIDDDVIANVFERQKRRGTEMFSRVVESEGQFAAVQRDLTRLEREKNEVLRQGASLQDTINGYALRTRELEGSLASLQALVPELTAKTVELERMTRANDQLHEANAAASRAIEQLRVEIERVNGLLDMIYHSKTWKLHTIVEKVRGRG